jgi:hypothetical protein
MEISFLLFEPEIGLNPGTILKSHPGLFLLILCPGAVRVGPGCAGRIG